MTGELVEEGDRNYTALAVEYAQDAAADTEGEWAGKWLRLGAERFLADLKRSQQAEPPFYFSARRAHAACQFIEALPHVEGRWSESNIVLQQAQIFFVVQLFGFRNHNGQRRYTEALLSVARKNGKSTLAAAIFLCCLCLESEAGAQLLSAATTGSQARIVWTIAKRMVERTPSLCSVFDVEAFANAIARPEIGGIFRPVNSKASTQDGLNPSHTCLDEIHAHKTHDLLNVLRSAAGARENPLWLYTTTEGYETPGPWPELRNYARQVLQHIFEADHFLAVMWSLDDDDDEFDETQWIKANPLLPSMPMMLPELRKLAQNAKAMPGTHSEFRIKRLNLPAAAQGAWISLPAWNKCGGAVVPADLIGSPCWAAFDLATTMDMAAWALLWLRQGIWYATVRYWCPEAQITLRADRRSAPYGGWVKAGFVEATDGNVINYEIIQRAIEQDCAAYSPAKIVYDPWNATQLVTNLMDGGLDLEAFVQGPRSYHPAMQAFEIAYTSGDFRHGGNPVLTWNAANVVARTDINLNTAPDRKKSADKIDGMCAVLMAFGAAIKDQEDGSAGFFSNPVVA